MSFVCFCHFQLKEFSKGIDGKLDFVGLEFGQLLAERRVVREVEKVYMGVLRTYWMLCGCGGRVEWGGAGFL